MRRLLIGLLLTGCASDAQRPRVCLVYDKPKLVWVRETEFNMTRIYQVEVTPCREWEYLDE